MKRILVQMEQLPGFDPDDPNPSTNYPAADNRIAYIVNPGEPEAPVDLPLFWTDAPDDVDYDWVWRGNQNGGTAVAPPPVPPPTQEQIAGEARPGAYNTILEILCDDAQFKDLPAVADYRSKRP